MCSNVIPYFDAGHFRTPLQLSREGIFRCAFLKFGDESKSTILQGVGRGSAGRPAGPEAIFYSRRIQLKQPSVANIHIFLTIGSS